MSSLVLPALKVFHTSAQATDYIWIVSRATNDLEAVKGERVRVQRIDATAAGRRRQLRRDRMQRVPEVAVMRTMMLES